MRYFIRLLLHAFVGGVAAGIAIIPAGAPITTRTILYPAIASGLTSVFSLLARAPKDQ